jgi:hypothetical protein
LPGGDARRRREEAGGGDKDGDTPSPYLAALCSISCCDGHVALAPLTRRCQRTAG